MVKKEKKTSELQGINHLIIDATIGVTDLVEAMHKQIVQPSFLPATAIQRLITNIAGITFSNFKRSTLFVGKTLDIALETLNPVLNNLKPSETKAIIISILNGVIGDYLAMKKNPLAIKMHFTYASQKMKINAKSLKENYPNITGKILLMVHGSCMNDIQWSRKNHNHGEILSEELGKTLLYLNYNSGKHISTNGQNLSKLLENLIQNWPVPVEEIIIIAHSMGGLVTRSALFYGEKNKNSWTKLLLKIVFLGTPHHGSHIERKGNYLDLILENVPYAKPFAKLGKIRSAGVTDLRYGNLVDEDWENSDRFELQKDDRKHIPLSENTDFYVVAASTSKNTKTTLNKKSGDNLVSLKSALGKHKNKSKNLLFKNENTFIAFENNHLDLLNNPEITDTLKVWLH